MKSARLAIIPFFAASIFAEEPTQKINASFYASAYAPGHEQVHVMTGAESYDEIQLSMANIVGPHVQCRHR